MTSAREIEVEINGTPYRAEVEPRLLLSDFIRHNAGLAGTHVGCEHGICGACTVEVDGAPVRSCLMLAVQAEGSFVRTIEVVGQGFGQDEWSVLQQAFHENHALQCGYCTPGFLMSLQPFLLEEHRPSEREIRLALSGNMCRCTGYEPIVRAVRQALDQIQAMRREPAADASLDG
jgi:aerobic-type carbon monoxide dehydrogenase small subunit (CoxS/CutS family)